MQSMLRTWNLVWFISWMSSYPFEEKHWCSRYRLGTCKTRWHTISLTCDGDPSYTPSQFPSQLLGCEYALLMNLNNNEIAPMVVLKGYKMPQRWLTHQIKYKHHKYYCDSPIYQKLINCGLHSRLKWLKYGILDRLQTAFPTSRLMMGYLRLARESKLTSKPKESFDRKFSRNTSAAQISTRN